ncbi:MAG: hypothetical protein ACTSVU_03210 [Promethearchaeota archaeon]
MLNIHRKPFATYEELASITQIPKTSVFEIVQKLQPAFFVVAIPNLRNLGLTTYDVFSEVRNPSNLEYLEKIGLNHPYVYYCARIYGKITGIYLRFRIPIGLGVLLKHLFHELKFRNRIDDFSILHFSNPFNYTPFDLNRWNFENFSWNFNWNDWFKIPLADTHSEENESNQKFDVKSWIQRKDIALLNKLIVNARRPNTKIKQELNAKGWDFNDTLLSRRKKKLETEAILGYKVQIDPHLFDIVNTVLIWGYGPEQELKILSQKVKTSPAPFYSVFNSEKFTLYWYIHLPTHQLSDLLHILQDKLYELHFMYVDYPKAQVYSLDPDAFDEKTHDWIQSKDFVIDDVLSKVDKM